MFPLLFAFTIKPCYCEAQHIRVSVRCIHLALIKAGFSAPAPHQTGQVLTALAPEMEG